MKEMMRKIGAVLLGLVLGSVVNMAIIMVSSSVIAPPDGVDVTTAEGLKAGIYLFEPKHFIMPFLAHALGTLVGAVIASLIAITKKSMMAYIVALFFFIGGAANILMLPSPMWFNVVDLVFAYFPMAWLAIKFTVKK